MDSLIALLVELLFYILELIWLAATKFLPAVFYFTSIVLVPAATLGKVVVPYPRKADKPYRSWQRSPRGRLVLSPVLGTVFGFSFWAIVAVLVIITHQRA